MLKEIAVAFGRSSFFHRNLPDSYLSLKVAFSEIAVENKIIPEFHRKSLLSATFGQSSPKCGVNSFV
ncbi:MAG: hypothetical protein II483_08750 [Lachnospiraceae bacterium]|nr:hypothetical protein [Lachnospiraceae bacterium]